MHYFMYKCKRIIELETEQVTMFFGDAFILSFQEKHEDLFHRFSFVSLYF